MKRIVLAVDDKVVVVCSMNKTAWKIVVVVSSCLPAIVVAVGSEFLQDNLQLSRANFVYIHE